ncbi:hypothetical protein Tco_1474446 [Tanacetum coccineum]
MNTRFFWGVRKKMWPGQGLHNSLSRNAKDTTYLRNLESFVGGQDSEKATTVSSKEEMETTSDPSGVNSPLNAHT